MATIVETSETTLGNTKPASKQGIQLIHWFMTWNNYTEESVEMIETKMKGLSKAYVFQKEVGESGTPHLQGYFHLKKKMRWSEFGLPQGIHWEKCASPKDAIAYCSKEDTRAADTQPYTFNVCIPKPLKCLSKEQLYPWQAEIVTLCEQEPNDRTIYWYWDKIGNIGKSQLVRYLCVHHKALMVSGKGADMKYLCVKYNEKHGVFPSVLIFDIPRSAANYVSYTGMEEIKNGCFASTKYECDMVVMNPPHMICFANFEPEYETMSQDRWVVTHL